MATALPEQIRSVKRSKTRGQSVEVGFIYDRNEVENRTPTQPEGQVTGPTPAAAAGGGSVMPEDYQRVMGGKVMPKGYRRKAPVASSGGGKVMPENYQREEVVVEKEKGPPLAKSGLGARGIPNVSDALKKAKSIINKLHPSNLNNLVPELEGVLKGEEGAKALVFIPENLYNSLEFVGSYKVLANLCIKLEIDGRFLDLLQLKNSALPLVFLPPPVGEDEKEREEREKKEKVQKEAEVKIFRYLAAFYTLGVIPVEVMNAIIRQKYLEKPFLSLKALTTMFRDIFEATKSLSPVKDYDSVLESSGVLTWIHEKFLPITKDDGVLEFTWIQNCLDGEWD
jgi:hypothetical protein